MAFSIFGIILLQYWIFTDAVALDEKQFDRSIQHIGAQVSRYLQVKEDYYAELIYADWSRERKKDPNLGLEALDIRVREFYMSSNVTSKLDSNVVQYSLYKNPADLRKRAAGRIKILFQKKPLEERIFPKDLDRIIKKNLIKARIDTKVEYGVYSRKSNRFVILNGAYQVNPGDQNGFTTYKDLLRSPFQFDLFESDAFSPGSLYLYFPNKSQFLWRSASFNLVATTFLIFLILACFAYTVFIIFRQKKISQMKNDFINNMTHEFKTPIATISLASDSIENPKVISEPDRVKRFIDIIKQENRRMLRQVEKVLDLAKIDKRDFQLDLIPLDIHEVLDEAIESFELSIHKRNGKIERSYHAQNSIIQADKTHIANIFYNLIDNAQKYVEKNPAIEIKTYNKSGHIYIEVSDNGIGISKENQRYIFDKFYRVPTGNVHNVKGFGLGLNYVQRMLEKHGGNIKVQSSLGRGSTFTVQLDVIDKKV
jgi:two-component system phosphate regulon sensor histidine kinase PhoR